MDVQIFNPFASSNSSSSLSSTFKKHENIKHRAYGQRIREVEHASFSLIALSATRGFAHKATECFLLTYGLPFTHQVGR